MENKLRKFMKYLGIVVTIDGYCEKVIQSRIAVGKKA